jgi:hypothetical protein
MLSKAIKYYIAGLVVPYVGMWFAGNFLLGSGESPNFLPVQIASLGTIFLSIGLFYLSKIEKRKYVRLFCLFVAVLYGLMHLGILLPQENQFHYVWLQSIFFLKIVIGVLAGIVLLGALKEFQNEI